jgi:tetratricopeptide (TPR) repeat protein
VLAATGTPPPTAANPLAGLHGGTRVLTALSLLAHAATLLVAPFELIPDYGRAVVTPHAGLDGSVLAGALLMAAALALAAWAWRRQPLVVDAVAWLLLPGLFAVGLVLPLPVAFAERWWYLPSLGACTLAAIGVDALAARLRPTSARVTFAAGALLLALFCVVTVRRNRDWRSDATLFSACVATAPQSAFCQYSLGVVLDGQARDDEALARYRQAAALDPTWAEPHAAAAVLFARAGRTAEADAAFTRMRAAGGASTRARLNYARFLARTGRRSDAERELTSLRQEVSSDEPQ